MTERGIWPASLEIRQVEDAEVLAAEFPYDVLATVHNRRASRKERVRPMAFAWQVERFRELQAELARLIGEQLEGEARQAVGPREAELRDALAKRNTHFLVGHSYDRPLGDMLTGNLDVRHTPEAVYLELQLPEPADRPSWVEDAVRSVRSGVMKGISPGFSVGANGRERLTPEPGNPGVFIRDIEDATVFEYSLVSRPAYPTTRAEARDLAGATPRRRIWL